MNLIKYKKINTRTYNTNYILTPKEIIGEKMLAKKTANWWITKAYPLSISNIRTMAVVYGFSMKIMFQFGKTLTPKLQPHALKYRNMHYPRHKQRQRQG